MLKMLNVLKLIIIGGFLLQNLYAMGDLPNTPGMGSTPEPASTLFVGSALVTILYKKTRNQK